LRLGCRNLRMHKLCQEEPAATKNLLGFRAQEMQSCGDSGIGRAVGREGADVLISYLNEEQDAQETARVVRESGEKCVTVAGDIGDESHCREIVQRAAQPVEMAPAFVFLASIDSTLVSGEVIGVTGGSPLP